jgi:type III restriction enzyme
VVGILDKGAHYLKTDLQIHTPRDLNWVCNGIGIPCTEIERKKYAEDFIKKCRNENIRIIAITDHHDMAFVKYIQEAAQNEKDESGNLIPYQDRIYVFSGMELTILGGFQAIILLNPTCTFEHFNALVGRLAIHQALESAAHSNNVTQLDYHNFNDIEDALNKVELLKDNFIILPHVGKTGSLGTILKNGNYSMYRNMTCVGGYIGHEITRHDRPLILTGKDPNWGSKSIGVFQTSDSREFIQVQDVSGETKYDFPTLGRLYTWVKVSEPTVEAIRQACLANETRLCQDVPKLPQVYITKLKV